MRKLAVAVAVAATLAASSANAGGGWNGCSGSRCAWSIIGAFTAGAVVASAINRPTYVVPPPVMYGPPPGYDVPAYISQPSSVYPPGPPRMPINDMLIANDQMLRQGVISYAQWLQTRQAIFETP